MPPWLFGGEHMVVKKDKGQPRGGDGTKGIEAFWSTAKHYSTTTGECLKKLSTSI